MRKDITINPLNWGLLFIALQHSEYERILISLGKPIQAYCYPVTYRFYSIYLSEIYNVNKCNCIYSLVVANCMSTTTICDHFWYYFRRFKLNNWEKLLFIFNYPKTDTLIFITRRITSCTISWPISPCRIVEPSTTIDFYRSFF